MRKKSAKPAVLRRSSATILTACLSSAAAIARVTCAGIFVNFFVFVFAGAFVFAFVVFASVFAMQPACRGILRHVRSAPSWRHRRVKSVMLNMLLHVRRHQPVDRFAAAETLPDRS